MWGTHSLLAFVSFVTKVCFLHGRTFLRKKHIEIDSPGSFLMIGKNLKWEMFAYPYSHEYTLNAVLESQSNTSGKRLQDVSCPTSCSKLVQLRDVVPGLCLAWYWKLSGCRQHNFSRHSVPLLSSLHDQSIFVCIISGLNSSLKSLILCPLPLSLLPHTTVHTTVKSSTLSSQ